MRALCCCFFVVAAVSCGAPRSEPHARLPPRPDAPPAAAAPRFPDASRAWGGKEYRQFLTALDRTAPRELPRAESALFERLVSEDNLKPIRDPKRPFKARLADLRDTLAAVRSGSERYFEAHARGGGLDAEFLRVHAFQIALVRLTWELVEESERQSASAAVDDAWHAARAEVPRATAALVLQVPTIVEHRELHAAANLAAFLERASAPLRGLFRRIAPEAQVEFVERLRSLGKAESDPKLRERLALLADALEQPDVAIESAVLSFGRSRVAPMPKDGTRGFDAAFKRSGPNDLYLLPLAAAASGKIDDPLITVDVAPATSARVLLEVLFTLGQHGARHWLLRSPDNRRQQLRASSPAVGKTADLAIFVAKAGISVKTPAGNLAPGCTGFGPGLTFPSSGGRYDLGGLSTCIERISAEISHPSVQVAPHAGLEFADLYAVSALLPKSAGDVPEIALLVPR